MPRRTSHWRRPAIDSLGRHRRRGDDGATVVVAGRLAVLGALAGVVGAGLGFALRHVAAVMGIALWWVLCVEVVAPLAWARAKPLTLGLNARAWVEGHASYTVPQWVADTQLTGGGSVQDVEHVVRALQGGVVLAAALAAVVAARGSSSSACATSLDARRSRG